MTRTERTYYLVFGLYTLWAWFIAPVYPLFLRSRGLDALEVNLVLAIYLIVVFALEVPTGAGGRGRLHRYEHLREAIRRPGALRRAGG